ncbi:unnamed protein product, partial [marine sediment metagenome]
MNITCPHPSSTPRAHRAQIADIFRFHAHELTHLHPTQLLVIKDITSCRTAVLGGHILQCDACDYSEISYNSCRNRHCPTCQSLAGARWVEQRRSELLPVPYFHLVFTIPECLNPILLYNKSFAYGILFKAVSETLKQVARNPKNLGANIGLLALLHTWDQKQLFHPHIHCIVPAGGLSPDKKAWIHSPKNYFLPVRVLSSVFRAKFLSSLE